MKTLFLSEGDLMSYTTNRYLRDNWISRKTYRLRQLLLFVISIANAQYAFGASFNCLKATTQPEQLICSNDELSRLDDVLTRVYKGNFLGQVEYDQLLRNQQRYWLGSVRDQCKDVECLRLAYLARIEGLKSYRICTDLTESVADDGSDFGACRYLPGHPDKLVVVRIVASGVEGKNEAGDLDLVIRVFDGKSKVVLSHLVRKKYSLISERPTVAVYPRPFPVSSYGTVIGITYDWSVSVGEASGSGHKFSLYTLAGKKLTPVLDSLDMDFSSGGVDRDKQCGSFSKERIASLEILSTVTNGYKDLQLTTSQTGQYDELHSGKCSRISDKLNQKQYLIKFDGKRYVVPKE